MRHRVRHSLLRSFALAASNSGATLAEMAMVLVLLLTLTFSLFEGGRLLWDYSVLSNAVSEGVRCASVRGLNSDTTSSCSTACAATDFKCVVQSMAVGLVPTPSVTMKCWSPAGVLTDPCTTPPLARGVVRLEAQYNFEPIASPLVPIGTIQLHAASEMGVVR